MSPANELHSAVEALLEELNKELVETVRQRDRAEEHRDRLTLRALDLEGRIDEVAKLEQRVRRMP